MRYEASALNPRILLDPYIIFLNSLTAHVTHVVEACLYEMVGLVKGPGDTAYELIFCHVEVGLLQVDVNGNKRVKYLTEINSEHFFNNRDKISKRCENEDLCTEYLFQRAFSFFTRVFTSSTFPLTMVGGSQFS